MMRVLQVIVVVFTTYLGFTRCLELEDIELLFCDFEDIDSPLCNLHHYYQTVYTWKSSAYVSNPELPTYGYRDTDSFILYDQHDNFSSLLTPRLQHWGEVCISFGYGMYGSSLEGEIYVAITNADEPLYLKPEEYKWQKQSSSLQTNWYTMYLDANLTHIEDRVIFAGKGLVVLDEIRITKAKCDISKKIVDGIFHCNASSLVTDWHNGIVNDQTDLCGFESDPILVETHFHWLPGKNGMGLDVKAPEQGKFYLYAQCRDKDSTWKASIRTPALKPDNIDNYVCVKFAYYMPKPYPYSLDIYTQDEMSALHRLRWTNTESDDSAWKHVVFDFEITQFKTSIVFQASCGDAGEGDIAIDDIHIFWGKCDGSYKKGYNEILHTPGLCFNGGTYTEQEFGYSCSCKRTLFGMNCNEVQPNIALNKPIMVSGGDFIEWWHPERLVDGLVGYGTCGEPEETYEKPWWLVDLRYYYWVHTVRVSTNYVLLDRTWDVEAAVVGIADQKHYIPLAPPYGNTFNCSGESYLESVKQYDYTCGAEGMMVTIASLSEKKVNLMLCEVEVFGYNIDSDEFKNVALMKRGTYQSADAGDTWLATDGRSGGLTDSCSHVYSLTTENEWWAVDLQGRYFVNFVRIWTIDTFREHIIIGTTDVNPSMTAPALDSIRVCNNLALEEREATKDVYNLQCWEQGRYVVVMKYQRNDMALSLCEVAVLANLLECSPGFTGEQCRIDIDECSSGPCGNHGLCIDTVNGYNCHCTDGYTDEHCETEIDECQSRPCKTSHGSCIDHVNNYVCDCVTGYTGVQCETDIDECLSRPCENGGSCVDQVNSYVCDCVAGYGDLHCGTDIDECHSVPCEHDGSCFDQLNSFKCYCIPGYTDAQCERDIDECSSGPCGNHGSCIDTVNGYSCLCASGFTDEYCQTDINECVSLPCENGGWCDDYADHFMCTCVTGYAGVECKEDIDECASILCYNDGSCIDAVNGYTCFCAGGYTDQYCETEIDECQSQPCENGGSCVDQVNSYVCDCIAGYGDVQCETDIDECHSQPCKNGWCVDQVNSFKCNCDPGYTDAQCETDINECSSGPCQNDGSCTDGIDFYTCDCAAGYTDEYCETDIDECESEPCQNGGACIDRVDYYICGCPDGYDGRTCEININECFGDPCENGGMCTDHINDFSCTCMAGYTGQMCQIDIDDCAPEPCEYGRYCVDEVNHYSCLCHQGFTGRHCEIDINECESEPCQNNGECTDGINAVTCKCAAGFAGDKCITDINECLSQPCQNGATCGDAINDVICICKPGFSGHLCEININECASEPCQNNGVCWDGINAFSCLCADGFTGDECKTNINECSSSPCLNGGSCVDRINRYSCDCPAEYIGDNCETASTDINECSSKPCLNNGSCIDAVYAYSCACRAGYSGNNCERPVAKPSGRQRTKGPKGPKSTQSPLRQEPLKGQKPRRRRKSVIGIIGGVIGCVLAVTTVVGAIVLLNKRLGKSGDGEPHDTKSLTDLDVTPTNEQKQPNSDKRIKSSPKTDMKAVTVIP